MRRLHSLTGLIAALIVTFMAVTGAILSLQPALETVMSPAVGASANVAELAGKVAANLPGVARITRSASGTVVAYYESNGAQLAARIDPNSGAVLGPYEPSPFFAFITELHRSLFSGDVGHAIAGVASAGIAILSVTGLFLIVSRMGGWRQFFGRAKGDLSKRLHVGLSRIAVAALIVTALTGSYMSLRNFSIIPDGSSDTFAFAPAGSGGAPGTIETLAGLSQTAVTDLRELVFPDVGDPSSVFSLTTSAGVGYVDQSNGALLDFTANNVWQQIYEFIYMLHTGQGAWWLGLMLGIAALAVPALAVTGTIIWAHRRRQSVKLVANASARVADTVILYGTENNTTLSFAASLHDALNKAGHKVHTASMNSLTAYPKAKRLLVLTSTYGDGSAPASANRFLGRLKALNAALPPFAVLGFGDRSFPQYCAFAEQVESALDAHGTHPLLMFTTIDRQSEQDFATWGRRLSDALGEDLPIAHEPVRPALQKLVLVDREDYGIEVQAPTVVLRFAATGKPGRLARLFGANGLPRFQPGDLVGILPPGSTAARYYSLASATREGILEICVRKQTNGLCSEFLHGLELGDSIDAFIRHNHDFRPAPGKRPLILIGAGAGIAPLAGLVRTNKSRPAYMFFGGRDPQSDFLYREQLMTELADGRLTQLITAFSRVVRGEYVQDRIAANAEELRMLIKDGAQIMVCGGLDMARGVATTFDQLLQPLGLSTHTLKSQGRYVEDAY